MEDGMQTKNMEVQQAVTAALEEQKKKKKKKKWIIVAIIAAVVALVIVLGSGGDKESSNTAGGASSNSSSSQKVNSAQKNDGKLGDYVCTLKSATKCKNWEGKDAIRIVYNFTNNSQNPSSFDVALEDKVFQDGIALESTFQSSDDEIFDVQIKPGVTKEVEKVYLLRNGTSDLEIEVNELLSFSNDKYTTVVKF